MPTGFSDIASYLGGGGGAGGGMVPATGGRTAPGPNVFGSRVAPIQPITGPTLGQAFPNLSGTNAALSSALTSELTGQLSPATIAAINDAAASYGVSSGMPLSGLAINRFPRDIGLATEDLIHRGIGDYSSAIPSVASTQTVSPNTQASLNAEIAAMNAQNAAAPDPTAAATYAQQLFDRYLNRFSTPAGGTSTSTAPWWQQASNTGASSGWGGGIPKVGAVVGRTYSGGQAGPGTDIQSPGVMSVGALNPTDPMQAYANWAQLASQWPVGAPAGGTALPSGEAAYNLPFNIDTG